MKKYLLTIMCLSGLQISLLQAQSFTAPQPSYSSTFDINTSVASLTVPITNTFHNAIDVIVTKQMENLAPHHSSLFCFGTSCFDTSNASSSVISFAGQSTEVLIADLNTNASVGNSCTTYRIYDVNNTNDFLDVDVCFTITTGIDDHAKSSFLSLPSPNPANKFTVLHYDLQGNYTDYKLTVFNILGNLVQENNFSLNKGVLLLSTAELTSGAYFYSLVSGNKVISTNKLIVVHKN